MLLQKAFFLGISFQLSPHFRSLFKSLEISLSLTQIQSVKFIDMKGETEIPFRMGACACEVTESIGTFFSVFKVFSSVHTSKESHPAEE